MITQRHAEASAAVPPSAMSSSHTGSVEHVFDTRPVAAPDPPFARLLAAVRAPPQ
jgi:hypothetical protein